MHRGDGLPEFLTTFADLPPCGLAGIRYIEMHVHEGMI